MSGTIKSFKGKLVSQSFSHISHVLEQTEIMDIPCFTTKIFHFYNRDSDGSILHINKQIQDIEIQTRYYYS